MYATNICSETCVQELAKHYSKSDREELRTALIFNGCITNGSEKAFM